MSSDEELYREMVTSLANYFRRKLDDGVVSWYVTEVKKYPVEIVKSTVRHFIENAERFPRLPEVREQLERAQFSTHGARGYDPIEDQNYPIHYLDQAYMHLVKGGKDTFKQFCDSIRMPREDRKRVICKYRRCYSVGDISIDGVSLKDVPPERKPYDPPF
jgi:hypothetical protein